MSLASLAASAPNLDRHENISGSSSRALSLKQASYLPPVDEPLVPAVVPQAMRSLAQRQLFDAREPLHTSWHLSVLNGGQPRAAREAARVPGRVIETAHSIWPRETLVSASWKFRSLENDSPIELQTTFGLANAIPLCADFNGDGQAELALFAAGRWWIDLNGNRAWDEDDLTVRLGDADDQPVLGDWDGDGKADIGVFG
ncbi:MAG TPA: VCBS repeat-containing protein, partial [Pirellulales bacterium]|nr:VCBS repeat-containing protein [Pirellulales bacterium]